MALTIIGLTHANWGRFRESLLNSEQVFPENIRTEEEDYLDILENRRSIFRVALQEGDYVGNCIGFSPSVTDIREYDLSRVPAGHDVMYIFNLVVDTQFQGRGYGEALLDDFVTQSWQTGFKAIYGHFRNCTSLGLAPKAGFEQVYRFPNWQDSGEEYTLCRLRLHTYVDGASIHPAAR